MRLRKFSVLIRSSPPLPSKTLTGSSPPALRRAAVESLALTGSLSLPRKLEIPIYEKVRTGSHAVIGIGLSLALVAMYLSAREHNPGVDLARMQACVAALRRARAAARASLLSLASESGEIALTGGGGRVIKWWASGPRTAPATILLAGEDGESAALWGDVHRGLHTALAGNARIISYHCQGKATSATDGTVQPSFTTRLRIARAVVEGASGAPAKSSLPWDRSQRRALVHVHAGAGAWAGIALAGAEAIPGYQTQGIVLVAPQLLHLSRQLAWVSAIPTASRQHPRGDAGAEREALKSLLEPPSMTGTLSPSLKAALDASSPRRKDMVDMWERFGTAGASRAVEGRFDEDFRRWRSRATVFSPLEMSLASSLASRAPPTTRISAVTWGPQAQPSWVEKGVAGAAGLFWASAATAAGAMTIPAGPAGEAQRKAYHAVRQAGQKEAGELLLRQGKGQGRGVGGPEGGGGKGGPLLGGGQGEAEHTRVLLSRLPLALGIPLSWLGLESHAEVAERAIRSLEREFEYLPGNFSATLVCAGGEEGAGADLCSLPLQAPNVIVAEILGVLHPLATPPTAQESEGEGRKGGGASQSGEAHRGFQLVKISSK